jgi:hypothetical protein
MCEIQRSVVSYWYGDNRRTIQTAEMKFSDLFFFCRGKRIYDAVFRITMLMHGCHVFIFRVHSCEAPRMSRNSHTPYV